MERASGRITAIHDDHVTVEVNTASFCARCSAGKGCGAGLLGADRSARQVDVPLPHDCQYRAGDQVTLELAPQSLLHASLIVYGTPLATVAAAGVLAGIAPLSDLSAALVLVVAAVAGVVIGRYRLRRTNCLKQFTPVINGPTGTVQ